jgi:cobalt-zinc-cadmium efflux system protein
VVYGVLAHSTALLADAAHNFGDVLGLLIAWGAYLFGRRTPTQRYTYGFRSTSILSG